MAELEFGCAVLPAPDPRELIVHAVDAAARGYDRFWVPDQTFLPDPFLLLQRIADRVSIDLGVALTNPFSRHPMQIARAMATLQEFDPGERDWVLGMGKGNSNLVLGPLGMAEQATSKRLAASLDIVKRLLAGRTVEPGADGFLSAPVRLEMDPVDCRVFIGTRGPLTLRQAAPYADGFITESLFLPDLVRWAAEAMGAGTGRPHVAWQSVVILEKGEGIPEVTREFAAMLMRTTASVVLELLGVAPATREKVAAKALTEADVTDDDVRRFVAIGSVDELREVVWNAYTAGATGWSSIFVGAGDVVAHRIARFADEVIVPIRERIAARAHSKQGEKP